MPVDLQHLIVYAVVLGTAGAFVYALLPKRRRAQSATCGSGCGCDKGGLKRHPVIARWLKRRDRAATASR